MVRAKRELSRYSLWCHQFDGISWSGRSPCSVFFIFKVSISSAIIETRSFIRFSGSGVSSKHWRCFALGQNAWAARSEIASKFFRFLKMLLASLGNSTPSFSRILSSCTNSSCWWANAIGQNICFSKAGAIFVSR